VTHPVLRPPLSAAAPHGRPPEGASGRGGDDSAANPKADDVTEEEVRDELTKAMVSASPARADPINRCSVPALSWPLRADYAVAEFVESQPRWLESRAPRSLPGVKRYLHFSRSETARED
jgi:hypothetical protein